MESENIYQNVKELIECQKIRAGGKRESLKPDFAECRARPVEPDRRNLSLRVICTLLGVCILLSIVVVVITVMLTTRDSERTQISITTLQAEISRLTGIADNYEAALGSIFELRDEILQLNMTAENSEKTLHSIAKIQDEISQLRNNTEMSLAGLKNELSQWKSNATINSEKTLHSIGKIHDKISQLRNNTQMSLTGLKNELSQWKSNVNFRKPDSSVVELRDDILQLNSDLWRCPTEWIRFRESCYQFSSSARSWTEAQRHCASVDAHLVVINNAEEQDFLRRTLQNRCWIGLSDAESEGDWIWVDGTDYSSSLTNWAEGEPNNEGYTEDCVEIFVTGEWNDLPCNVFRYWLCEKSSLNLPSI
ncbi:C-type lectin domain family 10 member A-like [Hypanus sabinus]|uniref:C-type lectin domain family 10 member A-like n=1 Tax=Hypanus sabinus TaxID=79690 RepID=UPI0028C41FDD|nr:C-type lectin domain family 10 member A-like [Hypanus sabinus]